MPGSAGVWRSQDCPGSLHGVAADDAAGASTSTAQNAASTDANARDPCLHENAPVQEATQRVPLVNQFGGGAISSGNSRHQRGELREVLERE